MKVAWPLRTALETKRKKERKRRHACCRGKETRIVT
jgi:hypothetical protein